MLLSAADIKNIRIIHGHKLDRLFGATLIDDLLDTIDVLQKQLRLAQMQNFDHESAIGCLERDYEDMQDERDDLAHELYHEREINSALAKVLRGQG